MPEAADRHDFDHASELLRRVLNADEKGVAAAARDAAARLPDQHLRWAQELVSADPMAAIREARRIPQLYPEREDAKDRARSLEASARVAAARRSLNAGDVLAVLKELAQLPAYAPLPATAEAWALIRAGLAKKTDEHIRAQDYPGLYRTFDEAMDTVQQQPRPSPCSGR